MKKPRFEVDPLNLEHELEIQTSQYGYWVQKTAESQDEYDRADSELDLVKAEIDSAIRRDPDRYGWKGREGHISGLMIQQPEYTEALRECQKAKNVLNTTKAYVKALEQRKSTLTLLVELWVKEYYVDQQRFNELSDAERRSIRNRAKQRTIIGEE